MKKIAIILTCILLLVGCSLTQMASPKEKTEKFLDKYKTLDEDVVSDLIASINKESLSEDNKKIYKDVLERQYKDLKYKIEDEDINDNEATVSVTITVYDLYKAGIEADEELVDNQSEYTTEGVFDNDKFMKYKLNQMKDTEDKKEYNIKIYLTKVDGEWVVQEPSAQTKEKIHGLYKYED